MGFFSETAKAQLWSTGIFQPGGACSGEDWGLCGGLAWENTTPGRFRRAGGNILNSRVLFTPKLWVWLVYSFAAIRSRKLHAWYLSQADVFFLRKTTQLFQRARPGADDTAPSLS